MLFLKDYIGYFGLWVLDIFLFIFSWLISTKRNIDLLLKQLKHKLLEAYDFIKLILSILYTRIRTFVKHLIESIKPKIQSLFAKKTQDILDLQNAKQETTTQAYYDFKDVFIDKAFDEMPQHPTTEQNLPQNSQPILHKDSYPAQNLQAPVQESQDENQDSLISISTSHLTPQEPSTTNTQPQEPNTPKQPHLEVVPRSQDDLKLEEFLRIQAEKYRNAFAKNVQHTALSDPAIKPRQDSIQQTTSQPTTPSQTSPESLLDSQSHTSPSKEIPTPPSRPINPDVFLKPKETKSPLDTQNPHQEIKTDSISTQNTHLPLQETYSQHLAQTQEAFIQESTQQSLTQPHTPQHIPTPQQAIQDEVTQDSIHTDTPQAQQSQILQTLNLPQQESTLPQTPTNTTPRTTSQNTQAPLTPQMLDLEIKEITPTRT